MSLNDVIDNKNIKLVDQIKTCLPHTERSRFAVGYLFLSGLEALGDALIDLQELKMLIGNTSNRQTIEVMAEGYKRLDILAGKAEEMKYSKRSEQKRRAAETAENMKEALELMDQSDTGEQIIETIVRMIAEKKLKVRVYTKGRLHAKAYIFDWKNKTPTDNGVAIVGSSNLSLAGIQNNTELNVLVHDTSIAGDPKSGNHAALVNWFEELWADSMDFDEALMAELQQSWAKARVTPYDIYLKTLYTLVEDRLEDKERPDILWDDEITRQLADFQKVAVRQAIQIIRKYEGCFVADVVGLGKSYIGAAIVKHFERTEGARPLILCPKPLQDMWVNYNETFSLNAQILSISMLQEEEDRGVNLLADSRYRDREFVLIDESHHFRNRGSQRYAELQRYLAVGRKVCLLTATPRNSWVWDVYNQIKLFHPEDTTYLPIDPPDLKEYFQMIENKKRRLQDVLSNVLIRRTRRHILRWYGYADEDNSPLCKKSDEQCKPYLTNEKRAYVLVNGRQQYFPRRELDSLRYSIDDSYNGLYDQIRDYLGTPSKEAKDVRPGVALTYARYGLWNYVVELLQRVEPYKDLHRSGINLRGLIRTSLFKRFESSVFAFSQSLKRMLRTHQAFLAALEKGIVPAGEKAEQILAEVEDTEDEDFIEKLEETAIVYKVQDFHVDMLKDHIQADISLLKKMIQLIEPITPDQDAKLQTLKNRLEQAPMHAGKCLIFTQFADTAAYIYQNLNPGGVNKEIETIYGNDKSKARTAWRFSPISNKAYSRNKPEKEIRILVSTDVMGEGLNLQDCNIVINYDLHWNPVRLIQRFGRVDRIGSEFDKIHGYNFLPEKALERQLGIKSVLRRRIQEIHATIGEDAAILDKAEQLNPESMYAIYDSKMIADQEDEFMDLNEAEEFFRQLKQTDPESFDRVKNLRMGIRCAKRDNQDKVFVFAKAAHYLQLMLGDREGNILSRDLPECLEAIKAEPETPGLDKLPGYYNQSLMACKKTLDGIYKNMILERGYVSRFSKAQRYVLDEIRRQYSETDDEDMKLQLTELERAFKLSPTTAISKELNAIRRNAMTGKHLKEYLTELYHQHKLKDRVEQTREKNVTEDVLRIVCSELV
jgi:superfamily II DNA or RNA helicase